MTVSFDEDMSDFKAGQIANIFTPNEKNLLPRPISFCEFDRQNKTVRFVYQVVGDGTSCFSRMLSGETLRLIAPIGNGYNVTTNKKKITLVGGGVGIPPMLELAKSVRQKNPDAVIDVILGFRSSDTILTGDFEKIGLNLFITTDDGSVGFKGNVVGFMKESGYETDIVYACGPKVMLKFLWMFCEEKNIPCFVSMEERMGCGLGVCVGCALLVKPRSGTGENYYKKVCKDGPVFNAKEVVWE